MPNAAWQVQQLILCSCSYAAFSFFRFQYEHPAACIFAEAYLPFGIQAGVVDRRPLNNANLGATTALTDSTTGGRTL